MFDVVILVKEINEIGLLGGTEKTRPRYREHTNIPMTSRTS